MARERLPRVNVVKDLDALPVPAYRLIDFPLSNCLHSRIDDVWVIQQYEPHELTKQLANGRPWDLDRTRGGLRILGLPITRPYPREQEDGSWLLVQDFERARLEFHPQNVGNWSEVLGTLAGNDMTAGRSNEKPFRPLENCVSSANRDCFVQVDWCCRSSWCSDDTFRKHCP